LKIAKIDLVFDNSKLIDLLEQRGQAIKVRNKSKINELEFRINQLKDSQYKARVIGAFVTYQTSLDINLAKFSAKNL